MASRSAAAALPSKCSWKREISDLNAAGSVLNWDQATYMPQAGAAARGRQLAMLGSLAHEARWLWREPAIRFRRLEPDPCRTP